MGVKRAALCNKHKPRVYKHQCVKCRNEEMDKRVEERLKGETNDAAADDSTVATEGE